MHGFGIVMKKEKKIMLIFFVFLVSGPDNFAGLGGKTDMKQNFKSKL